MYKLILSLLFVYSAFSYDVKPAKILFEQVDIQTPGRMIDTGWTMSVIEFNNAYFLTGCYWGIIKHNIGNKVAYSVSIYGSGRNCGTYQDTIVHTWDSSYQHPDYIWSFDELKAAPAGKVQVSLIKTDSIYLIISDTLKTTVFTYWQFVDGGQWNKHTVINESYSSLEYATVQNKQIVFEYPNANGWSISNGNLVKAGITYSSSNVYAVGYPFVDYKNNVWFYAKTPTDTLLIKLEAWNNFQNAFSYVDSARGYVKYLMNVSTDLISGYVGKGRIYRTYLSHPPTYIGPDTIANETSCLWYSSYKKVRFNQDTMYNYISTNIPFGLAAYGCTDSTWQLITDQTELITKSYTIYLRDVPAKTQNYSYFVDSFVVVLYGRNENLQINNLTQKTLTVGNTYKDTISSDGMDIHLTSTLPSWITATKLNSSTIVLSGIVPNVPSINTTISIIDSMIFCKATSPSSAITSFYRTATTTLNIIINPVPHVNHAPVAANDTAVFINEGDIYSYTLLATDIDGDNLTYSYSSTIPITQTNNIFVFSPETYGSYLISLYVTDGIATDSCLITLDVQPTTSTIKSKVIVKKPVVLYTTYNVRGQKVNKTYNINKMSLSNGKYIVTANKQQIQKFVTVIK